MNTLVKIHMVTTYNGDLYIGTAIDGPTFLSLIELAKLKDYTAVFIHGLLNDKPIEKYCTTHEAFGLVSI